MDIITIEEAMILEDYFLEESLAEKIAKFIDSGNELIDTGARFNIKFKGKSHNVPVFIYKGYLGKANVNFDAKLYKKLSIKNAEFDQKMINDFIKAKEHGVPDNAKPIGIVREGQQCRLLYTVNGKMGSMSVSYIRHDYGYGY